MIPKLSLVVPCYNESATLERCVERVLAIATPDLPIEVVIVDDASRDDSPALARELAARHPEVRVVTHEVNRGKGAALRTGFQHVTGRFVAVQDADLEYDPRDLVRLIVPLEEGRAEAVLGSRFLVAGEHRVVAFWHAAVNRFLTLVSNAFSDLGLTDMETCYKVFKREVIQSLEIREDRFGFEPEIVARLAARRLRIVESAIAYEGRSHSQGKKIRARDGWRALYCIVHYNARHAPRALRAAVYAVIGTLAAGANVGLFSLAHPRLPQLGQATVIAYAAATVISHFLSRHFLHPLDATHTGRGDVGRHAAIASLGALVDLGFTSGLISLGLAPGVAKLVALVPLALPLFLVRERFVFASATREAEASR